MTKERLQGLSFASLLDIAAKESIAVPEGTDKNTLIELIQEAMEEDRTEREQGNNNAMRVKEKKYEIAQDAEFEVDREDEYPLPERYNETRIVALLRDPLWAFAYWDLKDSEVQTHLENPEFQGLFLRICEIEATGERGGEVVRDYFEIPVKTSDSSWYINLPSAGRSYNIELRCREGENDLLLCRSNSLHSPLGEVAREDLHEIMDQADNDALVLTGLNEYADSSSRESIPQRIISMVDSDYLQPKG